MLVQLTIFYIIHVTFVDIDECVEGVNKCEQKCINTIGSYYCDCITGYRLRTNQRKCKGN